MKVALIFMAPDVEGGNVRRAKRFNLRSCSNQISGSHPLVVWSAGVSKSPHIELRRCIRCLNVPERLVLSG